MRLDKFLSHTGHGSRKEVKTLLKQKAVTVNGDMAKKPEMKIDLNQDVVEVFGEEVKYQQFVYLMLHKPAGVLSATEDYKQKTVLDLLPLEYQNKGIFPVGRLDKDTEGLLLLTNDGELAHFLLSPKKHVAKVYYAEIEGIMDAEDQRAFEVGITLEDGYQCLPAKLDIEEIDNEAKRSKVWITIQEGKFHQVKRMVAMCGKEVTYLKRLSMGSLTLDDTLKKREHRALTDEERANLETFLPNNMKRTL